MTYVTALEQNVSRSDCHRVRGISVECDEKKTKALLSRVLKLDDYNSLNIRLLAVDAIDITKRRLIK
jgi:hypothetical protein